MMVGLNDRQPIRERAAAPARRAPRRATAAAPAAARGRARRCSLRSRRRADAEKPPDADNRRAAVDPRRKRRAARASPARYEFRTEQVGRALLQAHRRHHRRAEEPRRAGVLGRPAVGARARARPATCSISTNSTAPAPRRPASPTSTCGTASSTRAAASPLQGPDFEGQIRRLRDRRRRAFHQGRRAQARALCRARDRAAWRRAGPWPVALPTSEPQPQTPRREARRLRPRGRSPAR